MITESTMPRAKKVAVKDAPEAMEVVKDAPKRQQKPEKPVNGEHAAPAKRKRGRPAGGDAAPAKKVKLEFVKELGEPGLVLTLGQGDTGQLGLGEDIMERSKPALVKDLENIVQICAGGMHSVCLTKDGEVWFK